MARCSCSGSTGCSCRLTPGDGILISGAGTPTDPFVITAEVTSFAAGFVVQDSATVDLNLVGTGTPEDPFILSASSAIAMTQLTDWDDPSGPAVGDVPTWNGLKWEATSVSVPAGTVHASGGIQGDGTLGTPLTVAVSDTTTTTTSGVAIYVDSAGKLRAVAGPSTIAWTSITGVPSTFPAAWTDVTGKPTSFPTTWSQVSGRPTISSAAPSGGVDGDIWYRYV